MKKILFIHILCVSHFLFAQESSWENPNFYSLEVDSLQVIPLKGSSIIEETLQIFTENGSALPSTEYQYDIQNHALVLQHIQKVTIEYYTYPPHLQSQLLAKDTALIVTRQVDPSLFEFTQGMQLPPQKTFDQLNTQGSLIRGLSFGNNQGASVQSSLNLTMDGKLSENLNIKANLSDYNIPIEQSGYTQQINEFENIHLSIYNENSSLNAGFITIEQKESYFANFNKKLTGVQLNTQLQHDHSTTRISATGSVSRGEFFRMRFQGIEGNQGPYQLKGKNNENFIVIIPNSEKVYIDGILISKGVDQDYTINYNTGELTFTSQFLISQNYRITVEYQYTALSYNRFLVYGEVGHQSQKLKINASVYSESDAKNSPKNNDLTNEQKQILSEAGNDTSLMYTTTATPSEYSENRVLYEKINNGSEEYYQYSTDPSQTLYSVSFTYVGPNNGNYIKENNTINGRVYSYIAPIGGVSQGNYAPLKQLIAPESRQVYTIDSEYLLKNGGLAINMALSNNDQNTFSSIDNTQNTGYAFRTHLFKNLHFKNWKLTPSLEYSFIQQNFYIIDRINKIEFNRDFNLSNEFDQKDQQQLNFTLGADYKNLNINYAIDFLSRKNVYNGNTQYITAQYQPHKTTITSKVLLHQDSNENLHSQLQDYQFKASRTLGKNNLSIGTHGRHSKLDFNDLNTQEKQNNQYYYIQNNYTDSLHFSYKAELYRGINDTLQINRDVKSHSTGFKFNTQWMTQTNDGIELGLHYRTVHSEEKIAEIFDLEKSLLSHLNIKKSFIKNSITFSTSYNLGGGSEPQREFQYAQVSDGNGIYKWTDYNNNGIQEIDEFEIAEFQDLANYVRVYTQTLQYLKTAKNEIGFSLQWNPAKIWNTPFANRWNFTTNYQKQSSFLKGNQTAVFNPFENQNLRFRIENFFTEIRFNRIPKNKYEISYKYFTLNNFRNDYLGLESLNKKTHQFKLQNQLWESFTLENLLIASSTSSYSQNLASKNYKIAAHEFKPSLTYSFLNEFSVQAFYHWQYKENQLALERLHSQQAGVHIEYQQEKSSLLTSFSYVNNTFSGTPFSLIANQMMEGLKNGKNLVWNISFQKKLANFLYLNLNYEGRKSEQIKTIHIGNAQIKLIF